MNGPATARRPGIIGLGAVGYRLAARLLDRFGTLVVLDRDAERLARALALGGEAATDAMSVGGACDVVLLSLPSPPAVKEVMEGPRGLLAGIRAGAVVIDTSTVDPDTSREWAAETTRHGAHYLDAPITCSITPGGGTAAAACGELTFLVGGEKAAFDSVRDVLGALGRRFHHLGPPGSGSVMKLVSNHISGIQTLAIAEALCLAESLGFPAERTLEICADTVAGSYVMDGIVRARLSNPSGSAHFAMELMAKDHRLAEALARSRGIELPMNRRALELCEEMCEAGYARRDNVASVEYFRERPGTPASGNHPIDRGAPLNPAVEGSTATPPPNPCTAAASRRSGR